jgi:hypothetical protein
MTIKQNQMFHVYFSRAGQSSFSASLSPITHSVKEDVRNNRHSVAACGSDETRDGVRCINGNDNVMCFATTRWKWQAYYFETLSSSAFKSTEPQIDILQSYS